jgi:hypothetical protein
MEPQAPPLWLGSLERCMLTVCSRANQTPSRPPTRHRRTTITLTLASSSQHDVV